MTMHETLLRLAGSVPDDLLADARTRLADGAVADVARMLVFAGNRTMLPLTDEDLDLLAAVLRDAGQDPYVLDTVELIDPDTVPPWRFMATPPEDGGDGRALVAALAEGDLVAALAEEPAARGLWRAWRTPVDDIPYPPPRPVYVVAADSDVGEADLPALTARLQRKLVAAGDLAPQVEVTAIGDQPPLYQRLARAQGSLLWAAVASPEITVARVFDAVDADAGPSFAPDHPRMTDEQARTRTLAYLKAGAELLLTTATFTDVVDPARGAVVPMSFRTDGTWIWTDTVTYYLEEHQLAPDPELLRHITEQATPPEDVDPVALHRAMAVLTNPSENEAVWTT
jgi:hypothetical protein